MPGISSASADRRSLDRVWQGVASRARRSATAYGMYVLRRGEVAGEYYAGSRRAGANAVPVDPAARFNVYSVRKAYIGFATAWAIQHGFFRSVDDRLAQYVDSEPKSVLGDTTIRHVLTHSHGLDGEPGKVFRRFAPGRQWHYTNTGTHLLGEALLTATGESVATLLRRLIFEPLSFVETGWETAEGEALVADSGSGGKRLPLTLGDDGGTGRNLYVSARELARFGWLHLSRGRLADAPPGAARVEPEAFALAGTLQTPQEFARRQPRHGFFWWMQTGGPDRSEIGARVPVGSYQIVGMSGCVCLVVPSLELVAVRVYNGLGGNRLSFVRDVKDFGNDIVKWALSAK